MTQGLPGLGELLLFEVEVSKGYVNFGETRGDCGGESRDEIESGLVMLLRRAKLTAAAMKVAEIEVGADAVVHGRVLAALAGGDGLVVTGLCQLIAAIGDQFHA